MKRILPIFCLSIFLITSACGTKEAVDSEPTAPVGTAEQPSVTSQNATQPAPVVMPGDVKPIKSQSELSDAEKHAASGDAAANASLALYYYNGGEPIDVDKAALYAKTAAEAGVVEGKYVLAELLLYHREDKAAATGLRMAQEASEAGYIPGVAALGKYYFMGRVVPRDENKARQLFEQAAAQNDPNGLYSLGMLYATGAGVQQNSAKAAEYFKKAADQGLGIAQFALATQYAKGEGVPQNIDEAIRLYQGPANAGNVRAQVNLATILLESNKNPAEGVAWLRKAANQGSALAKFFLADCLISGRGVAKNESEAFTFCKQAAESGLPIAQGFLGELYFQGIGTTRDLERAAHWFGQAATWGDTVAMFRLAGMYYEGMGVKKDINEAYYWAVLAEATEPVEETRGMRTGIGQQLSEQQRKAVERRAQDWKPKTMPM